jgi:hypothetical protein
MQDEVLPCCRVAANHKHEQIRFKPQPNCECRGAGFCISLHSTRFLSNKKNSRHSLIAREPVSSREKQFTAAYYLGVQQYSSTAVPAVYLQ